MHVVLAFSGGLDSTVLLYHLRHEGHTVRCLSVDYGQRHSIELERAREICRVARVEHRIADLRGIGFALAGSSQTSDISVPEGHYAEPSMATTVVPNRNMILLSVACAWAISSGSNVVAFAAHAGDHPIYPDCRPEFADAIGNAMTLCHSNPVQLVRQFIDMTKADVVGVGHALNVPFAMTWSCYNGRAKHCGKCGTCFERREAFEIAGVADPTEYEQ